MLHYFLSCKAVNKRWAFLLSAPTRREATSLPDWPLAARPGCDLIKQSLVNSLRRSGQSKRKPRGSVSQHRTRGNTQPGWTCGAIGGQIATARKYDSLRDEKEASLAPCYNRLQRKTGRFCIMNKCGLPREFGSATKN